MRNFTITIYYNNGKKKTIEGAVFYKYTDSFLKISMKDHKSLLFPYGNVNYIEIVDNKEDETND